jgi:Mce-associated membrane protein
VPPSDLAGNATDANDDSENGDTTLDAAGAQPSRRKRRDRSWRRAVAYGLLPALAMLVTVAAAYLKWEVLRFQAIDRSATESVAVAQDTAVSMLSYHSDTVERDLGAALDRMTAKFRASYVQLTHDVVIPGARQRHISAEATVKAAASVRAQPDHADVMLFIDQNITIGQDPPTTSASSIHVTLDKVDDRWLVTAFDPV